MVLHRLVVFLVDRLELSDRLVQLEVVRMVGLHLQPVIPQKKVVLQGPLERLDQQVREGDYPVLSRQLFLYPPHLLPLLHHCLEFALSFKQILQILVVDEQGVCILLHLCADAGVLGSPGGQDGLEFLMDLL